MVPTPARPVLLPLLVAALAAAGLPASERVGALGTIEPVAGIVNLAGPSGAIVEKVLVAPDRKVAAGDPLVVFAGAARIELELAQAEQRLADADASGKSAIAIQEATLARLATGSVQEIETARLELASAAEAAGYATKALARLVAAGSQTFSANQKAQHEHQAETARIAHELAKTKLSRVTSGLASDRKLAELELARLRLVHEQTVASARLAVDLARTALSDVRLLAPSAGTVLEVLVREGERASGPLIRLADLGSMAVRARIFQSDLLRVAPGMKATVSHKILPRQLTGTVASIGRILDAEARVAPVLVHLADPETAARLLQLEVEVTLSGGP